MSALTRTLGDGKLCVESWHLNELIISKDRKLRSCYILSILKNNEKTCTKAYNVLHIVSRKVCTLRLIQRLIDPI